MEIDDDSLAIHEYIYNVRETYYNILGQYNHDGISGDIASLNIWRRFVGGQEPKNMVEFLKNKIEDPTPLPELSEREEILADMLYRKVKVEELIHFDREHKLLDILKTMLEHLDINIDIYSIYTVYDDTEIKGYMYYINRIPGMKPVNLNYLIINFTDRVINKYSKAIARADSEETREKYRERQKRGMILLTYLNDIENINVPDHVKRDMIRDFQRDNAE